MSQQVSSRAGAATCAVLLAGTLASPATAWAQSVSGQARAVQASVANTTTTLADTGTLGGASDMRDATQSTGLIASVFSGEALHAVTIGWPDQAASEVSLTNMGLRIGAINIAADVVMARVLATLDAAPDRRALIGNLSINGVPVAVTGAPNQTIPIAGGHVVLNEQTLSSGGATVNALHATVFGVADVVIASATAAIR